MTEKDSKSFIPNSFQVPNVYIDEYLHMLSGNEFKVLVYAIRRIFGFNKRVDRISISQFCEGIKSRNSGEYLDHGTGLARATVIKALDNLEKYGLIARIKGNDRNNNGAMYQLTFMPSEESPITEDYEERKEQDKKRMEQLREIKKEKEEIGGLTTERQSSHQTASGLATEPPPVYPLDTHISSRNPVKEIQLKDGDKSPSANPSEDYREHLRKEFPYAALGVSIKEKLDGVLGNLYDYPAHIQETIKAFSRKWRIPPPPKDSSDYSKWCKDATDVYKKCKNAQLSPEEVFKEAYYIWKTPPKFSSVPREIYEGN
jgi:hypothetical protein